MSTSAGPNIVEDGLVLHLDPAKSQLIPSATQIIPDSDFSGSSASFNNASAYRSTYHVGEIPFGEFTGNSVIVSGADAANYYGQTWQTIDTGDIGTTGGNWRYYSIFPSTTDATKDYVIDVKWRFKYVSKTGLGTTNPYMQIGNGYSKLYTKYFNSAGYDWQIERLFWKGSSLSRSEFVFACSSADSAVEIDYIRCYRIDNLNGSMSIDFSDQSKTGKFIFDGADDYIGLGDPSALNLGTGNFTLETFAYIDDSITSNYYASLITKKGIAAANAGFSIYFKTDTNKFLWSTANGLVAQEKWSTNSFSGIRNSFSHIVMVRESGAINNGHFYINGQYEPLSSSATVLDVSNSYDLNIGIGSNLSSNTRFKGKIGMTNVYNRALSSTEVKQNFNALRGRYGV